MDKERFRQELLVAAVNGFASNAFLAQQLAALDLAYEKTVEPTQVIANLAVNVANRVLEQMPDVE